MRNSLFFLVLASSLYAQQLTVRSASASRVELAWTGASPEWQVERRSGSGQFEKLAAVSSGAYADEKIGAYATYHYRVRNQAGAVSNEVIVGPPPAGVNIPARLPVKVDPEKYGAQAALCNDENGDPAIAFVWTDVNGDSDNSDNTVDFVHWDRAHYSWKAPVKIGVMGDVSTQNVDPVSLACDRATGAFALSFPVAETQGVQIALLQDGGATWQTMPLAADLEGAVSSTAMATANGRWLLAFALAIDSHGRVAALFDANSGTGQTACGPPSVSISTDGVRWTTCGLGKRTGGSFDVQSTTIGAFFGPDGRLNVVWHQVGENKFGQGILLWRE